MCIYIYMYIAIPDSVREWFFGLWTGCANTSLNRLNKLPFCTCHNLNPNTLSPSKLLPSKQRSTRLICLGLWLCKRKLELIPFCTCQNPNPNTLSSSQLLPTNKDCASTPPEAELHKLRVLHSACYSARPQNAVNTMRSVFFWQCKKNAEIYILFFFGVCSHHFWENTLYLQHFVAVHWRAL